jgi:DNA polymerase elongation subunit (family B)
MLLCAYLESIYYYKTFVNRLKKDSRVAQLFNTELSQVQQYLFIQLKVESTCKVQVQYDSAGQLISLTKMDEFDVQPPPFTALYFEVITSSSLYNLDSRDVNDPLRQINARYKHEAEITLEGNEEKTILEFCKYVVANDPDILISTEQHYRSTRVLQYLFARYKELGIDIELGRGKMNKRNSILPLPVGCISTVTRFTV